MYTIKVTNEDAGTSELLTFATYEEMVEGVTAAMWPTSSEYQTHGALLNEADMEAYFTFQAGIETLLHAQFPGHEEIPGLEDYLEQE